MYIFHLALSKDNSDNDDGDKQLIRSLKENIKLSMNNAKSKANDIDLLILDSINRSINEEIDD
jgi:3-oxoacyl-[acyl-carrier-protein] synthase III